MTIVEFFEKEAVENICSAFIASPERVVLVGENEKLLAGHAENYRRILSERKINVEFIFRIIKKKNLDSVTDALSGIAEEFDDCVFDVTGGDDLYLVAMGAVMERFQKRGIQIHRFNVSSGEITDCDQDGETIMKKKAPSLSIDEHVGIYGGCVVYEKDRADTTFKWELTPDFRRDVGAMWDICRKDPRKWNAQIGVFAAAEDIYGRGIDSLEYTVPVAEIKKELAKKDADYVVIGGIVRELKSRGLFKKCDFDEVNGTLSVRFKNHQVKYCLTTAGLVLEMKVFIAASDARDGDGSKTYNDVMNGVYIDWDGDFGSSRGISGSENEIDVMMMHGMVPVFVSCKNGDFDSDELYKLNAVANRFGGKYAKKVIVSSSLFNPKRPDAYNYMKARAKDMGIYLAEWVKIEGEEIRFTDLDDRQMNVFIRSLWSG